MRWYFLRHAKTERVSVSGQDVDRALNERGIKQAHSLQRYVHPIPLQRIVCSSALRTRETCSITCAEKPAERLYLNELYLADLSEWKVILGNYAKDHTLFIGHNDGISDLLAWLTDEEFTFPTAGWVTVDFLSKDLQGLGPGTAQRVEYFRPTD